MRSYLWRLSHLSRAVRWLLLLAVLLFFLIALPSFIKEPDTKPIRDRTIEDPRGRATESLQKATTSPAPATGSGAAVHHASAQGNSDVDTGPGAPGRAEAGAPGTARTASLGGQEGKDARVAALTRRSQDSRAASNGTRARPPASQDPRTAGGRQDQDETPPTAGTGPAEPRGAAAATAGTSAPESRAEAPDAGAGLAGRRAEGAATAVALAGQSARATRCPACPQSPATRQRPRLQAADFKSEPRWDFEEKYSFDTGGLQTKCPDSVKVRASKSLWLRNLFLPNLTLFLDSRRFGPSEWSRLQHFVPPFGFMELDHSLVRKVVTRFPPVPQQQLLLAGLAAGAPRCISCAVVGNGGILNASRVGHEIDSHDYVFRLNGAVTEGYEQDVGTRTSFYGFTAFSLTQSLVILGHRGFRHAPLGKDVRYLHFLEGTRDYEWLEALLRNQTLVKKSLFWFRHRPQQALGDDLRLDRYLLLHPDFLRYVKNRFLRSKTLDTVHWRIYRPTTGALLLFTALQLCDQVSAYGFITEGHQRFSDHYYDTSWKKTIFYINHDFELERTLWKRLHEEGIIRLYQRPATSKPKS